jgi:hypothetical protein
MYTLRYYVILNYYVLYYKLFMPICCVKFIHHVRMFKIVKSRMLKLIGRENIDMVTD